MSKYYAVKNESLIVRSGIIAEGDSFSEVSERAAQVSGWKREPGSVAPYCIVSANWFEGEICQNSES